MKHCFECLNQPLQTLGVCSRIGKARRPKTAGASRCECQPLAATCQKTENFLRILALLITLSQQPPRRMPKKLNWSKEQMCAAVEACRDGKEKPWDVSKSHKVPYDTLIRRLKGNDSNAGETSLLDKTELTFLVSWSIVRGRLNWPVNKKMFTRAAMKIILADGRPLGRTRPDTIQFSKNFFRKLKRDFPDLVWKKEDQLWKLLREGLKPQLISLCTEHKVDANGTMPEMRGRIAPELKRKGLLSRCTEEQIAELINKK